MRLANIKVDGCKRLALEAEGRLWLPERDRPGADRWTTVEAVIADAATALPVLAGMWQEGAVVPVPATREDYLPPVERPSKNILCLGWNYAEHAEESQAVRGRKASPPGDLIVFTKAPTSVTGPYATVRVPCEFTDQLDWEVELGVVIGRRGRRIDPAEALDYVFGYTVINDLSARDVQFRHRQYFLGKSFDGACPLGPYIVTAETIPDCQNLELRCWVNGELKQHASTASQIFPVREVIAVLSRWMTLEPGDIIATGTPAGVGFARRPPQFLQHGDRVTCEIDGIGRIENTIERVSVSGKF